MDSNVVVPFARGTVLAGKYRVERVIGHGGMGIVLAARHLGLDEMVAVKLIRDGRAEGPAALARFQREARAAARIKSEHVARVLDVDRLPDGAPYIVMELIEGEDLDAVSKRGAALPAAAAASYVLQACEGLAEAHALGMVHRDLKLKNLFLSRRRDGRALIKVIDFGVVKVSRVVDDGEPSHRASRSDAMDPDDATLTGAATLVGSVHYMAPEQIRASNVVTAQADVWSLGVCLYTLLTGSLPFDGETVAAVCASIQGRPCPDVRALAPLVAPGLAAAVERALEKDTRRRFADVGELAAALVPFGEDPLAFERIASILRRHGHERASERRPAASALEDDTLVDPPAVFAGRVESTIDAVGLPARGADPSIRQPWARWIASAAVAASAVGVFGLVAQRGLANTSTPVGELEPPRANALPSSPRFESPAAASSAEADAGTHLAGAPTMAPSTKPPPVTARRALQAKPAAPSVGSVSPVVAVPNAYDRF